MNRHKIHNMNFIDSHFIDNILLDDNLEIDFLKTM